MRHRYAVPWVLMPLALCTTNFIAGCGAGSDTNSSSQISLTGPATVSLTGAAVQSAADVSTATLPIGRYVLVNALSGKCVDVAGASTADGGNIQQASCNTNLAQVFDVTQPSSGIYRLTNVGSGKVIDVAAASTADGANVQQAADVGSNAQRFTITRTQGNRYVLTNVNSSKCVDVAAASLDDGANIQQANCNGSGAQQFHFYPRSDAGRGVLPVGQYTLSSNLSRMCVDIEGGSITAGAKVIQNACSDSVSQRFDVLPETGGSYRFSNAKSGQSLDVSRASTANGALLLQWPASAGNNQRFIVNATNSGYQIIARHSNRCVDVKDWSTVAGGTIQQWTCVDQANQRWAFTPATGETTPPPPQPSGWSMVWQDEFNGNGIDTSKWSFEVNGSGGGNNELQYYTSRSQNASVANGVLTIQALQEHYCSTDGCREYTSARLRTLGKGDWLYGRMEVRAKLPRGQGLWPAIWMLPTDSAYGGWAASGEIDIMEAVNAGAAGGNTVYGTLHFGGSWPNNVYVGGNTVPNTSITDNFHTYAVEWEPTQIRFYVDNVLYHTAGEWWSSGGAFPAPFNKRFHMLLNVAVGGNWPGAPNASTAFPQKMEIDYVRVYQKAGA